MPKIHLTRIAALSPFPNFLESGGYDVARQLTSVGIAPESLSSQEALFPLVQGCEFINTAARKCGINRLGMEVGARTSIKDLGMFGVILGRALTLNDVLRKLVYWIPDFNTGAEIWTEPNKHNDSIKLFLRHTAPVPRDDVDPYALFLLIAAVRMAAGPQWRPKKIWIDADPKDTSGYEIFSDATIIRDVDYVAFEIPRSLLGRSVTPLDVGQINEDDFHAAAPSGDLIGSITQMIQSSMGTSLVPPINYAAELAGMNVRTLQRKLKSGGLFYREIIDRVRFEETRYLFRKNEATMNDIALHLGYSDGANFNHAFRRWTGQTPGEYRVHMQSSDFE